MSIANNNVVAFPHVGTNLSALLIDVERSKMRAPRALLLSLTLLACGATAQPITLNANGTATTYRSAPIAAKKANPLADAAEIFEKLTETATNISPSAVQKLYGRCAHRVASAQS
jgi:hypothetical protein